MALTVLMDRDRTPSSTNTSAVHFSHHRNRNAVTSSPSNMTTTPGSTNNPATLPLDPPASSTTASLAVGFLRLLVNATRLHSRHRRKQALELEDVQGSISLHNSHHGNSNGVGSGNGRSSRGRDNSNIHSVNNNSQTLRQRSLSMPRMQYGNALTRSRTQGHAGIHFDDIEFVDEEISDGNVNVDHGNGNGRSDAQGQHQHQHDLDIAFREYIAMQGIRGEAGMRQMNSIRGVSHASTSTATLGRDRDRSLTRNGAIDGFLVSGAEGDDSGSRGRRSQRHVEGQDGERVSVTRSYATEHTGSLPTRGSQVSGGSSTVVETTSLPHQHGQRLLGEARVRRHRANAPHAVSVDVTERSGTPISNIDAVTLVSVTGAGNVVVESPSASVHVSTRSGLTQATEVSVSMSRTPRMSLDHEGQVQRDRRQHSTAGDRGPDSRAAVTFPRTVTRHVATSSTQWSESSTQSGENIVTGSDASTRVPPTTPPPTPIAFTPTPSPTTAEVKLSSVSNSTSISTATTTTTTPPPSLQVTCVICMTEEVKRVFIPCGHIAFCDTCADLALQSHDGHDHHDFLDNDGSKLRAKPKCPLCRRVVKATMRFYVAGSGM
ncbi:hypothetical protein HDU76_006680 [Blyttiomyces sp. JEL0837]|nr:hypothetical protein HDU76_006680 [Blyttiomyces sp. JEL0837]